MSLMAALVFFWAYREWLSGILLTGLFCLPLLSLLLSLPAMLTCKAQINCPVAVNAGSHAIVTYTLQTAFPPSVTAGRAKVRLPFSKNMTQYRMGCELPTNHCGALKITSARVWMCDYLGLFSFPVSRKTERTILIRPQPKAPADIPNMNRFLSAHTRPKPGGGYAENHELRLYRPGDNLRQIHWKLSAKAGDLIIREPMDIQDNAALLTLSLSGTPGQLDGKLSQLLWVSNYLVEQGVVHRIYCQTGSGPRQFSVKNETETAFAIDTLLQSAPATEHDFSFPKAAWRYHIGGDGNES